MTNNQGSKCRAQAKKDETLFVLGMIGVIDQHGSFIREHAHGFMKRDTVLAVILGFLRVVPFESERSHDLQYKYDVG